MSIIDGHELDELRDKAAEADDLRKANALLHELVTSRDAEIEQFRAALKPFAEAGRTLLDEPDETGVIIKDPVTVGDFRRAAEACRDEQSAPSTGPMLAKRPVAFAIREDDRLSIFLVEKEAAEQAEAIGSEYHGLYMRG